MMKGLLKEKLYPHEEEVVEVPIAEEAGIRRRRE
jgi:hypothetical protein